MNRTIPPTLRAQANGIELAYDSFGDPADPALLLIMGLGTQMIAWDEAFCEQLAARGLRVIRFDNRDIGQSTWLTAAGVPDVGKLLMQALAGQPVPAGSVPYTLADMAADAVGLLDALGVSAGAHRRRVDGRRDRPGNRAAPRRAGAHAGVDHVDHRRTRAAAADARRDGDPDDADADRSQRLRRALPARDEGAARRRPPRRGGARSATRRARLRARRQPGRLLRGSSPGSSRRAAGANGCARCARRRW